MSGGPGQKRCIDQDHCLGGAARFSASVKKPSTSAFACHMRSAQLAPTRSPPTVCPMRLCQQHWIPKPPKDEKTFSLFILFSYRAAGGPTIGSPRLGSPRSPRHATQRHAMSRHRHASPRPLTPRLTTSRHASPCLATPRHATPRHATPQHRLASPRLVAPHQSVSQSTFRWSRCF